MCNNRKKILLEVLSIEQSIYRKPKEKQLKKKVEKLSEAPRKYRFTGRGFRNTEDFKGL